MSAPSGRALSKLTRRRRHSASFELVYTDLLGPITPTALGGFQYVKQVHRREDQVEGNPAPQIEGRGSQVPAAFHTGGGGAARISHPAMSCGQRQRVHRRRVSELLSSNRHQAGVCCNQHAGTGGRVGASGPHTCGDNSTPAGGQRAAEVPLGRADVGCHLPCKPDTTLAEYAYATTNTQLQMRSEGETKAKIVPNTFSEARKLPEAALWEAAKDKEIASLIKHQVYDLVPSPQFLRDPKSSAHGGSTR